MPVVSTTLSEVKEEKAPLNDKIYASLLEVGKTLVKAETGSIYIWKHNRFYRVYTNTPANLLVNPRKGGLCYVAFAVQEPCITPREEVIRINPQLAKTDIQSRIYVPLAFGKKSVGVMTFRLYRRKKSLTRKELEMLKMLGSIGFLLMQYHDVHQDMQIEQKLNDSLLNIAAHELRTPLTTMNIYLQLLQKKDRVLPQPTILNNLEKVSKELSHVVDEIISVESIKNDHIHFDWKVIDIKKIVTQAYNVVKKEYPKRAIELKITIANSNTLIKADSKKLKNVFIQLLGNAVKFSSPDTKVLCKISYKDPHYIVSIEDFGIGFVSQDAKKIFKAFFKGKNNFKNGMGLGLFLARKIIQYHRGFILIRSKENKGTKIKIFLPEIV